MRVDAILASFLLVPTVAHSKCIQKQYEVHGAVVTMAGSPIAKVKIKVTWKAWPNFQSVTGTTDTEGKFNVLVNFDKFSGESLLGEKCDAKFVGLTVEASNDSGAKTRRYVTTAKVSEPLALVLRGDK